MEQAQDGTAGRGGEGKHVEKEASACAWSMVSQALSLPSPSEREMGAKGSDRVLRLLVAQVQAMASCVILGESLPLSDSCP